MTENNKFIGADGLKINNKNEFNVPPLSEMSARFVKIVEDVVKRVSPKIKKFNRVLEVQMGEHFVESNHEALVCNGSGEWSTKGIGHVLETGTNVLDSIWTAECPKCRKIANGVGVRNKLRYR